MGKLNNRDHLRITTIGIALICFACVAYMITTSQELAFDKAVREWLYSLRGPVQNTVIIAITYLGNWQAVTLVALALLIIKKTRIEIGVPFAITAIVSTVIYKLTKMAFQRPRPDLGVRIIEQGGYSFPSGHAMNSLVCYGILIYLTRRYCKNNTARNAITVLLSLLFLSIGLSRVYVGVHFPTDILGGWSLGIAVLTLAIMCIERIRGRKSDL